MANGISISEAPGLIDRIRSAGTRDLLELLTGPDAAALYGAADLVRREEVGDRVYLRGIVEFGSYCENGCAYCGLNRFNRQLPRYRMEIPAILSSVRGMYRRGIRTVVLQSGEERSLESGWLADLITRIKGIGDLAVTLSAGEKSREEYRLWREAGADRYLLKIETTDRELYGKLHPGMSFSRRLRCLDDLQDLGYQTGSGIITGLPGQTLESLAEDLLFFRRRDFDMVSIGPFIPHPRTELCHAAPGGGEISLRMIALTRILTGHPHMPANTALGSLERDYRIDALRAGANVVMPNFTPGSCREKYEIYPGKKCLTESVGECDPQLLEMLTKAGRPVGTGRGDSRKSLRAKEGKDE